MLRDTSLHRIPIWILGYIPFGIEHIVFEMSAAQSTKFGGSVSGTQVTGGTGGAIDVKRKAKDADKGKGKSDTHGKVKSFDSDRVVNDSIGASVQITHAFGLNALPFDGLQSYAVPASGGEKVCTVCVIPTCVFLTQYA